MAAACNPFHTGETDPRLCRQTYEFGNTGCVRVEGRVLGSLGQPLHGIYVHLGQPPDRDGFDTPVQATDVRGRFRLEAHRMTSPGQAPTPDTITMWLIASRPAFPVVTRDSVAVLLYVAPVGQPAITVTQDLTLPAR